MKLIKTTIYLKSLRKLPKDANIKQAEEEVAKFPKHWPVIPGTGGIRKARFAIGLRGKRGGGRLCYLFLEFDSEIYFLKAYSKNKQEDLSLKD